MHFDLAQRGGAGRGLLHRHLLGAAHSGWVRRRGVRRGKRQHARRCCRAAKGAGEGGGVFRGPGGLGVYTQLQGVQLDCGAVEDGLCEGRGALLVRRSGA
eukprot:1177383-Prorocentrum_minimum.AAC.1